MDPNATLEEIRNLYEIVLDEPSAMPNTDLTRLAELIGALDGWITRGGFLPDAWNR